MAEYKRFIPMSWFRPAGKNEGKHVLGIRLQGSFVTGYGGFTAPPFQRFYMGGENDLRGFDTRSVTPYSFIYTAQNVTVTNASGVAVPVDPSNSLRGNLTVKVPVPQLVSTGGDTSIVSNIEYRIPIAGPVVLSFFNDFGLNAAARSSQLQLNPTQVSSLNNGGYGCANIIQDCTGYIAQTFASKLTTISGTNWKPRMSTGVEVQVQMPIINAPFRIYYAINPLRLNTTVNTPSIPRNLFPNNDAGTYTWEVVNSTYAPKYTLKEPFSTFRFTVSTTF